MIDIVDLLTGDPVFNTVINDIVVIDIDTVGNCYSMLHSMTPCIPHSLFSDPLILIFGIVIVQWPNDDDPVTEGGIVHPIH